METKRKERSVPKTTHPYLALLIILAVVAVLVNIIPSGQYDRIVVDGRTIVDPSSYHKVDKVYSGIWNFFYSFYQGYCDASSLIAMVFFVGAGFGVVKRIGLLQTAISVFALKIRRLPFAVVSFLVMLVISAQVLFTGMWELNLVLLPVVIPLFMTLGYDLMTGVGVVMISSFAAFGCALTNPFSTAIAHQIAELPIYSAMGYRFLTFCIVFLVGWVVIMPIMVPLADIAGITRQTACLAFQYGDGFSNFIFFTNGSLIAMLMVADIPYTRWVKFFWKLFLLTMVLACLFCAVAAAIHLGPF